MDGKNVSFPIYHIDPTSHQEAAFYGLVMHKSALEYQTMSFGDKITGDVYYKDNSLADVTDAYVYVEGVKYVLVSPPTIVREGLVSDNSELNGMTKYSFTFYHPMYIVGNFPFTDIAVTQDEERYLSQNKTFSWIGNLNDFIAKLNANLRDTEWLVTSAYASEEEAAKAATLSEVLTFDKNFVTDACKTAYEQWEIPFTVIPINQTVGGVQKNFAIKFGTPTQEILDSNNNPYIFQMGQGVGLKNNSRTPRNNKIVTRIVGYGSEKNIPYGYPQIQWHGTSGAQFTYGDHAGTYQNVVIEGHTFAKVVSYPIYKGILGGQYVSLIKHPFTRTTLMPTVYSEDVFNKVSPYLSDGTANTDYDPDAVIHDYYDADAEHYVNPCNESSPCVEIHQFEKIKPELGEEYIEDAMPYDNVAENPLETAIALANFLAQIQYDLTNNVTNQNEVVALNSLYNLLSSDGGERHFADQGGSYTFRCDVTYDTYYYYVKYVSDNINYDVVCLKTGAVVTPVWDDTMDDDGNYVQSYFKMTLPQLSFDMYACASITENMQINMRSGACMGCTFDVQVDWEDYKRNFYNADGEFDPVPHTTEGDGHVRDLTKYPDTSTGSVTFILQKDLQTFGTIMPNVYQQPRGGEPDPYYPGDKFVILGISLPQSYVDTAQIHLDDAMKEYMLENNAHYFDYPLKFDEFFLAQNTNILSQITLNSIVRFRFPTQQLPIALFVKAITIKYGQKELPEYDITLTDDIEIVLNQIGQVTDDVSRLRVQMSEIQKFYSQDMFALLQEKLSKVEDDIAQGRITFQQGLNALASVMFSDEIKSKDFSSGLYEGKGWRIDNLGNAEFESARVRSFLEIVELLVNRIQCQEGETVFADNDQIERVDTEVISNITYYTLSFKEKFEGYKTCQKKGNILKGIINTIAALKAGVSEYVNDDAIEADSSMNTYYTSWMRVIATHNDDNTLDVNQVKVVLFGDGVVPASVNFAPCELMNVVRWGCVDASLIWENPTNAQIEDVKRRQNVFVISTKDGRITKYRGVNSPTLREGNYGTTLGILPDFVRNWSIGSRLLPDRDYLYAQGVVVGDFIKVDSHGLPIVNYVDCGEWIDGNLVTPRAGYGIYYCNQYNEDSLQWETHDVWHNGAKWRCLESEPYTNPDTGEVQYIEPTEANSAFWMKLLDSGEAAVSYEVEWTDANGATDAIACNANGTAKVVVGIGTDPWITASLYKRVGEGERTLVPCQRIELHAFNADGTENTTGGYPLIVSATQQSSPTSIFMENYEAYMTSRMKYRVDFYITYNQQAPVISMQSSICRVKDGSNGNDGLNGTSTPQYSEEFYAWSNDATTANVNKAPKISGSWSTSIPQQGSYAYLWKQIIRYTLVSGSNPPDYQGHTPEYYRLNGENGTSIKTKGIVLAVLDRYETSLPLDGDEGEYIVVDSSPNIYKYIDADWEVVGVANNGDYCIMKGSDDLLYWESAMTEWDWTSGSTQDGDSYTNVQDGHLWMYSREATDWLDLGQFKGENGKTYYTHIAWAVSVTIGSPRTPSAGCINYPNGSNISGATITPNAQGNQPYMGYRIDEIAGNDSTEWLTYTWQYVKGNDGERGKIGRFFYFGGDFNENDTDTLFEVNDAQTPYFRHIMDGQVRYHVFNPTTNPGSKITMSQMWNDYTRPDPSLSPQAPSFNMYPWESMTNDFKYLITEAIFGNFAKFGSAIISGDWMLSACGVLYDTSDNPHAIDAEHSWGSYNINNAYAEFDAGYPNSSKPNAVNFVPNYCVDFKIGTSYMKNANIDGELYAGKVGGFDIINGTLHVGDDEDWATERSGNITLLNDGQMRLRHSSSDIYSELALGEKSDNSYSDKALVIRRSDTRDYQFEHAALEIGSYSSSNYNRVAFRAYQGVSVFSGGQVNYVPLKVINIPTAMDIHLGNSIVLKNTSNSEIAFVLPTFERLRSVMGGLEDSSYFAVPITIVLHKDSKNVRIKSTDANFYAINGSILATGSDGVPMQHNWTLKLMMVYENSESFYIQKMYNSADFL